MSSLLVCGVGNPLRGDDAIGPYIVRLLQSYNFTGLDICWKPEIDPLDLPILADQFEKIIIIDAGEMHIAAGNYKWYDGKELAKDNHQGTHSWGIPEGLSFTYKLNPEAEAAVLLVQAENVDWFKGMSATIVNRLKEISDQIKEECYKYASHTNN